MLHVRIVYKFRLMHFASAVKTSFILANQSRLLVMYRRISKVTRQLISSLAVRADQLKRVSSLVALAD